MKKFILGLLTAIAIIPIIDSLVELVQVAIEIPKGNLSKKVIALNNDIQDLQAENEPVATNCVGFQYDEPEYEYEDDDFEDKKCGFVK
ncbi:hypothetical protein AALB39_04405 [Lachnospiraceae bacterium 54-53]